jgi:anti-sigma regulatory factor (Ser/Thr protein kinase)
MALLCADEADYLDGVIEFLVPGLEAGEPIALAVPPQRAAAIRSRLGDCNGVQLEWLDVHEVARNPARIIPAVFTLLDGHAGRRLHYVGDFVWPERSDEEIQETMRHEALINLAWPDSALRVLCVYDETALDPAVIRGAHSTHPWLMRGASVQRNAAFGGASFPAGSDNPLPDPPADALTMAFGTGDLAAVRRFVADCGDRAGLMAHVRDDLVIAVNEVATNTIKYAPNDGLLRIWSVGARVVCQFEDRGQIGDPLAGRHRPIPGGHGGLGLWMVNQLCDLVQTRTTPAGTTIRLHARADG